MLMLACLLISVLWCAPFGLVAFQFCPVVTATPEVY